MNLKTWRTLTKSFNKSPMVRHICAIASSNAGRLEYNKRLRVLVGLKWKRIPTRIKTVICRGGTKIIVIIIAALFRLLLAKEPEATISPLFIKLVRYFCIRLLAVRPPDLKDNKIELTSKHFDKKYYWYRVLYQQGIED